MTKPLIVVTGATGKTGAPVVEQMLERGYKVRAFVHGGVFSARTDIVERIGGRTPQSLAEFVREHIHAFTGQPAALATAI